MQEFLDHLQHTTDIANFNSSTPTITLTACREKIKVWRESTTTSPSGLHLGHFKSMIARFTSSEVTDDNWQSYKGSTMNSIEGNWLSLQLIWIWSIMHYPEDTRSNAGRRWPILCYLASMWYSFSLQAASETSRDLGSGVPPFGLLLGRECVTEQLLHQTIQYCDGFHW